MVLRSYGNEKRFKQGTSRPQPLSDMRSLGRITDKDLFDRQLKHISDSKGQRKGRIKLSILDRIDRVPRHGHSRRQFSLTPTPFCPQDANSILHTIACSATSSPKPEPSSGPLQSKSREHRDQIQPTQPPLHGHLPPALQLGKKPPDGAAR